MRLIGPGCLFLSWNLGYLQGFSLDYYRLDTYIYLGVFFMSDQQPIPEKEMNKLSDDQIIDSILANMPSNDEVAIDLPSKNKFYSLIDPSKPVTLRPMTFEDERSMISQKASNSDILNVILERCISNVRVPEILQMDKLYLVMKLREISYGDEYKATITCTSCKEANEVIFNLSTMPVTSVEDDLTNPVVFELPVLKKEIKVTLPRIEDEHYFSNAEFAVSNLWRFVESIDGNTKKTIISKIVPKLPLKDAHTVLECISASKYGIDTKVRFACAYCSFADVMELPISTDFFTAT